MTRQQVADLYFMEARSKLIELAAFFDRIERATGDEDFRVTALKNSLHELSQPGINRAKNVLMSLSDPTLDPLEHATTKAASGAWKKGNL